MFICEPAALRVTAENIKAEWRQNWYSDRNRIQGGGGMQIASEYEMMPSCLSCRQDLNFSDTLPDTVILLGLGGATGPVLKTSAIIIADRSIPSVHLWSGTTGAQERESDRWAEDQRDSLSRVVCYGYDDCWGATLRRPRRGGLRRQCSSTRHLLAHLGTMIAVVQPLFEAVSAGA